MNRDEDFEDAVTKKRWAYLAGGALHPDCPNEANYRVRFKTLTGVEIDGDFRQRAKALSEWARGARPNIVAPMPDSLR